MADKTTKTMHIKWVRSGIGFPRRQKTWVRSLGLKELNQVVERPDTPQIRGLVARARHLLEIVEGSPAQASASEPGYTLLPAEIAPVQAAVKTEEATEQATPVAEAAPATTEPRPAEEKEEAVEAAPSGRAESRKPAARAAAAKKVRPEKETARKGKKPGKEAAAKETHTSKGRKK
jgi:large subunit ribosomal protein L30